MSKFNVLKIKKMKIKTFILLGLCLKYEAHIYNSQFLISKLGSQSSSAFPALQKEYCLKPVFCQGS